MTRKTEEDPEFKAMRVVYEGLNDLDANAQKRVLEYVLRRLSLDTDEFLMERSGSTFSPSELARESEQPKENVPESTRGAASEEEFDGVSPIAQRWIRRNGLTAEQLSKLFTLGIDEIDLIAKTVPGKNRKNKMRSVALLTGIAAYLGSGAPRVQHEALREALSHYNVYDANNFARDMKDMAGEISGSKETGYTLTARGLAAAAQIVNELTAKK
jgi:hypothetical protein